MNKKFNKTTNTLNKTKTCIKFYVYNVYFKIKNVV